MKALFSLFMASTVLISALALGEGESLPTRPLPTFPGNQPPAVQTGDGKPSADSTPTSKPAATFEKEALAPKTPSTSATPGQAPAKAPAQVSADVVKANNLFQAAKSAALNSNTASANAVTNATDLPLRTAAQTAGLAASAARESFAKQAKDLLSPSDYRKAMLSLATNVIQPVVGPERTPESVSNPRQVLKATSYTAKGPGIDAEGRGGGVIFVLG